MEQPSAPAWGPKPRVDENQIAKSANDIDSVWLRHSSQIVGRGVAVHPKLRESDVDVTAFRQWLVDRDCSFEPGVSHGHAFLTVYRGNRKVVFPDIGPHKELNPGTIRRIAEDLGLNWNELPDRAVSVPV
jgi:hypothetical protein